MRPTVILAAAALGLVACQRPQPLPPSAKVHAALAPASAGLAVAPPQPEPQRPGPGVAHPGRDHDRNGPLPLAHSG
jgi:hypothetical protein